MDEEACMRSYGRTVFFAFSAVTLVFAIAEGCGSSGSTASSGSTGGASSSGAASQAGGSSSIVGSSGAANGGSASGGASSSASGAPGSAPCGAHVYECGDTIDNDHDGLIDSQDPDCLGPCDNTENSFYGGIP